MEGGRRKMEGGEVLSEGKKLEEEGATEFCTGLDDVSVFFPRGPSVVIIDSGSFPFSWLSCLG